MTTESEYRSPHVLRGPAKESQAVSCRDEKLDVPFERIKMRQSTSLVGKRPSGGAWGPHHLMDEVTQGRHLPDDDDMVFVEVHPRLGIETPRDFFCHLFSSVAEQEPSLAFRDDDAPDYWRVRDCLEELQSKSRRLVLLLDGFEGIAKHEAFPLEFFSFLRGIADNYDVTFVTLTDDPLARCCPSHPACSPFFNIFAPVFVGPSSP